MSEEAIEIKKQRRLQRPKLSDCGGTKSMLGSALVGKKKYKEAEQPNPNEVSRPPAFGRNRHAKRQRLHDAAQNMILPPFDS